MAGVSFPVSRSAGEALVVASPAARAHAVTTLATLGIGASQCDDPYAAMAELCRRPMVYRAVILSLAGVYTEELEIISAIKRRFPQVEVWLAHTDGRYSSLAEAMRLGAEGLLSDDGLHRIAGSAATSAVSALHHDDNNISANGDGSASTESNRYDENDSNGHAAVHLPAQAHADAHLRAASAAPVGAPPGPIGDGAFGEPVLTADELRALLQESSPSADDPGGEGAS